MTEPFILANAIGQKIDCIYIDGDRIYFILEHGATLHMPIDALSEAIAPLNLDGIQRLTWPLIVKD